MYACMHVCMNASAHVCIYACTHACIYVCVYVWGQVCSCACTSVCMHVLGTEELNGLEGGRVLVFVCVCVCGCGCVCQSVLSVCTVAILAQGSWAVAVTQAFCFCVGSMPALPNSEGAFIPAFGV